MKVNGYKEFLNDLKQNELSSVLFLEGEEEFLIHWAVENLSQHFVRKGMEAMDYAEFSGEDANADQIIESLETMPMLSEKRIVWLRNIPPLLHAEPSKGWTKAGISKLISYIENPNPRTIAVFSAAEGEDKAGLVKALRKNASVYTFGKLNRKELASFANKRFKKAGKKIEDRAMRELLDITGYYNKESEYRLYQFESDLKKIIAHSEKPMITCEDVESTVHGEGDRFIFNLLDGISGNDKSKAFSIIQNSLADGKENEMKLIVRIASQMELLLEIREFMDNPDGRMTVKQMQKYTGINGYRLEKASQYARKYSKEKLRQMVLGIYEANARIVQGILPARLALEMFVASI